MKKILCVFLCLTLCFSLQTYSLAKQRTDEADASKLETAIALEILEPSAASRAEESISRGEFIDALVRLRGLELTAADIPFTDLSTQSGHYESICTAYALGYINGYPDGTFRETEPITKSAAVRLLTYVAGWKELLNAGMDYADAASKSKICSYGFARDNSDLSVAEAAQILLEAGNAYVVRINRIGSTELRYYYDEETVFEKYREIYRVEDILEANEFTYVYSTESLGNGMVKIGDKTLRTGNTDAETLLGYRVTAYYRNFDQTDDGTLIYITGSDNDVLSVCAEDYIDYDGEKFKYANEKGDIKSVRLTLSAVDAIYNEKLLTMPKKEHLDIDNGTITLIDNDFDGEYEVVKILCYQTLVVESVDKDNQKIFGKWGGGAIDLLKPGKISFISQDGGKMNVNELAEWDVLSVARSLDDEILTIIYATGWNEGEITAYSANAEPPFITVNGKTYELSDFFITHQGSEIKTGVKAMILLDVDGKVAAANFNVPDEKGYAYIIKTKQTGSKIDPNMTVKYMDSDGKINIADMAKTFVLNGKSVKTKENLTLIPQFEEQLTILGVNAEGCIDYIDTAYTDRNGVIADLEDEESTQRSLCKFYDGYDTDGAGTVESLTYKTATRVFGYKLGIGADTKVFVVPHTPSDDDFYHVFYAVKHFLNDTPYTVQGYKSNPDLLNGEVLVYKDSTYGTTISDDTPVSVVESVIRELNDDGAPTYKITVYSNASRYEYRTKDDSVYTDVTFGGKPYQVEAGDVVRLAVDASGLITKCELVYSCSNDSMAGNNPNSTNQWATFRAMKAYVYQKYNNNFITTTTPLVSGNNYELSSLSNAEMRAFSSYWQILVFDTRLKQLSVGSSESVTGYLNSGGAESSKVFVYDRRGDARVMVVYN